MDATGNRNFLIDNLKFILILLVVMGHAYAPYMQGSIILKLAVTNIYTFHMPLFIFLSGYFSKSEKSCTPEKIVTTLLLPYILFTFIWYVKEWYHTGDPNFDLFSPPFHLWYLLSLFTWKLLLPVIRRFKYMLILSIAISLLVGLAPAISNELSLSRTFALYPFFILGTYCTSAQLNAVHAQKYLMPIALLIVGILGFVIIKYNTPDLKLLLWDRSYKGTGIDNFLGIMYRCLSMSVAALIGLAVIVATPGRKVFFTDAGSRTLPVYILHAFLLPSFLAHLPNWNNSMAGNTAIILLPFVLVIILSMRQVNEIYTRMMAQIQKIVTNPVASQFSKN